MDGAELSCHTGALTGMVNDIEVAVIGGGLVGLLTASALQAQLPSTSLALFEAESHLGEQNSTRNSEVLHAGIHYQTGSLKHRLCIAGNQAWRTLASRFDIPLRACGKYVVATSSKEQPRLQALLTHAKRNRVPGFRAATAAERRSLGAQVRIAAAAFFPSSATIDTATAVERLDAHLSNLGVPLLRHSNVLSLARQRGGLALELAAGEPVRARVVVNCAGLGAVRLRRTLGLHALTDHWVKGQYLVTAQPWGLGPLVYPLPPSGNQGLGIHISFDPEGGLRFGPDANPVERLDFSVDSNLVDQLTPRVLNLFPKVDPSRLRLGYAGIRPQVWQAGVPHPDFWLAGPERSGVPGYFECAGIESPGLTAAPALASELARAVYAELAPSAPPSVLIELR
ncbi:MAG: FAD-dependent oxidoreductase [Pseudomonadota bacterium]|nr:FAD-dependent oxidoreductase [Pseudomonadota bacterium]